MSLDIQQKCTFDGSSEVKNIDLGWHSAKMHFRGWLWRQKHWFELKHSAQSTYEDSFKIKNIDFFETTTERKSLVLFNPPYGERLRIEEDLFYEKIGNHLKHNFVGNEVWIFSQNNEEKKLRIGLKPSTKIKLKNGSIDCSLNKYEIFSGKNKERFN